MTEKRIRTRFAPSPTGYLHIGGARTALFSYLFARHNKGDFLLRIEDTDQTRYVEDAVTDIEKSLKWLGIEWDGPLTYQSKRLSLYQKDVDRLISEGKAYRCFCTPERLETMRETAMKNKTYAGYDRACRNLTEEEIEKKLANNESYVVRLKVPGEGKTVCHDLLRGDIEFDNSVLEDIILLKSDGYPTYHLAHAVDDTLMNISHVTRGEEWISSMPIHVILFNALGYDVPEYVHLPVILSQEGGKLSKRHGATSIKEFIQEGYLPEALMNFLAMLGWSYDDKEEIFSKNDLIRYFDLSKVSKSAAVFSYEKLNWYNAYYLRNLPDDRYLEKAVPFFIKPGYIKGKEENGRYVLSEKDRAYLENIIPLIKERIEILSGIESYCNFFFKAPDNYKLDDFLDKKRDLKENIRILEIAMEAFEKQPEDKFNHQDLEEMLRVLIEKTGIKVKNLFMPLRVSITGRKFSPGLFEMIEIFQKKETVTRIKNGLDFLRNAE